MVIIRVRILKLLIEIQNGSRHVCYRKLQNLKIITVRYYLMKQLQCFDDVFVVCGSEFDNTVF